MKEDFEIIIATKMSSSIDYIKTSNITQEGGARVVVVFIVKSV